MKVDFDVKGLRDVEVKLNGLEARARDPRPAMRVVRTQMQESNKQNFDSDGAHLGTSWAPNAPATLKRKGNKRPNRDTGALEASLTGGKGKRSGATRTTARAGTSLFYAQFAQTGTKKAPRRAVVGLTVADQVKARETVLRYIATGIL